MSRFDDYRRGVEAGTMESATPNVVRDLLDEIERLQQILSRIEAFQGCECDSYEGHRCLMCRVREMAREGRTE